MAALDKALDPKLFAGVLNIVEPSFNPNRSLDQLDQEAVMDDLDGEKETIPALEEGNTNIMGLLSTVNEVSKGVSDGTHAEYQQYVVSSWSHSHLTLCSFKPHKPV